MNVFRHSNKMDTAISLPTALGAHTPDYAFKCVIVKPDSPFRRWYHSTYNHLEWTVSMAGEGLVQGRFHGDASLGRTDAMKAATLTELAHDLDTNRRSHVRETLTADLAQ